jgi:hypothetical protein
MAVFRRPIDGVVNNETVFRLPFAFFQTPLTFQGRSRWPWRLAMPSLTCPRARSYACGGFMMFIHLLAVADMPPKESGGWIGRMFDWCVDLLLAWAAALHISYNAINVIIFCIIWPVITLALVAVAVLQRMKIRKLERAVKAEGGN